MKQKPKEAETHPSASLQKRLLIVSECFYPSVGGMEVRYLELGSVFVANGWTVDVATIALDAEVPSREEKNGISILRLVRDPGYKLKEKRPNSKLARNPKTMLRFAWSVRGHLQRQSYDLVIFSIWPLLPPLLSRVRRGTVAMIDWCEHRSTSIWPVVNRILSKALKKHISVSEGVMGVLKARYGIKDIACIPSGIFVKNYSSSPNKSGVLFFGRLVPHKRPEEAIHAMIRARELGFCEHLTVAGGGPQTEYLRETYGHLDFLRFAGSVSDEEKHRLFAGHRIYLLPSVREGFPITVAEAMASGTPTITTRHPDNGTVAVVRQYGCGLVVEPGAEAVGQAIWRLAADSREWQTLSEQGLARIAELDWHHVFASLLSHAGMNHSPEAGLEPIGIGSQPFNVSTGFQRESD